MSNARYFADGVDFWRVLYDDGSTEGPYFNAAAAKRVGETGAKLRQKWSWAPRAEDRVLLHEWRSHESYKLQKLTALMRNVEVEHEVADPFAISHVMEPYLAWEDWSA